MKRYKKPLIIILIFVAIFFLQYRKTPDEIKYGVTFTEFKSRELNLDPKTTFDAIVNDLGVRDFRLSSHWTILEKEKDNYNFGFLDYQINKLDNVGGRVILTLGRRQPAWPECHEPDWVKGLSKEEKEKELLRFIEDVVLRYKDSDSIKYWQVENEPFLSSFATEECGELDKDFLKKEIELVHSLDDRKVLVTDSGNLGLWKGAWSNGDLFGTSLYRFFWTPDLGIFESKLPPAFFRAKHNLMRLFLGKKEALLIELAAEPWLTQKIVDTPIDVQLDRMSLEMFKDTIDFASKTGFDEQYLWGAEWWYWLSQNNHKEYWQYAKTLFK